MNMNMNSTFVMDKPSRQKLSHGGLVVARGRYTGSGETWTRQESGNRRYKEAQYLPDAFTVSGSCINPVGDERFPTAIRLRSLPWNCGGGLVLHLLCGANTPVVGCLMLHRVNESTMEAVLIHNATGGNADPKFLARMAARCVTDNPIAENKMLEHAALTVFAHLPVSDDLPNTGWVITPPSA